MKKKTWVMAAGLLPAAALIVFALAAFALAAGCGSGSGGGVTGGSDLYVLIPESQLIWIDNSTGVTIRKYTGPGGFVIIPDTLGGKPVTSIDHEAFGGKGLAGNLVIPQGVTLIPLGALINNNLTSVSIPASVTAIDPYVFNNNINLKAINVDPANTAYKSVDGVLFTYDGTKLVTYPQGRPQKSYNIPNGVEVIEEWAFASARMTDVTFPGSLTTIKERAFYLNFLESISIPSVTTIGPSAFYSNPSLTMVVIGQNVTLSSGWPGNFEAAYNTAGKAAGTYMRANAEPTTTTWSH
jgi:hypothetical protein